MKYTHQFEGILRQKCEDQDMWNYFPTLLAPQVSRRKDIHHKFASGIGYSIPQLAHSAQMCPVRYNLPEV